MNQTGPIPTFEGFVTERQDAFRKFCEGRTYETKRETGDPKDHPDGFWKSEGWKFIEKTPAGGSYYYNETEDRGCTVYTRKVIVWSFAKEKKAGEIVPLPWQALKGITVEY